MTTDVVRITDDTPADETRDVIEARTRRLMAERARLALTWETRTDRLRLLGLIEDALDEWLSA